MSTEATPNLFERIPPPSEVRERIAQHVEEGKILRRLLRVSEEAAMRQSRDKSTSDTGEVQS